jgi:hypothetical protein
MFPKSQRGAGAGASPNLDWTIRFNFLGRGQRSHIYFQLYPKSFSLCTEGKALLKSIFTIAHTLLESRDFFTLSVKES